MAGVVGWVEVNYLIHKLVAEASATFMETVSEFRWILFPIPILRHVMKLEKLTDLCRIRFALYLL